MAASSAVQSLLRALRRDVTNGLATDSTEWHSPGGYYDTFPDRVPAIEVEVATQLETALRPGHEQQDVGALLIEALLEFTRDPQSPDATTTDSVKTFYILLRRMLNVRGPLEKSYFGLRYLNSRGRTRASAGVGDTVFGDVFWDILDDISLNEKVGFGMDGDVDLLKEAIAQFDAFYRRPPRGFVVPKFWDSMKSIMPNEALRKVGLQHVVARLLRIDSDGGLSWDEYPRIRAYRQEHLETLFSAMYTHYGPPFFEDPIMVGRLTGIIEAARYAPIMELLNEADPGLVEAMLRRVLQTGGGAMTKPARTGATYRQPQPRASARVSAPSSAAPLPVLTAGACLHASPEETARILRAGVLHGRIGEGTPDAADVIIDLRDTEGGFVPQQRDAGATAAAADDSDDMLVGFLPWWWWWWSPRGRGWGWGRGRGWGRFRMRMDGTADYEDVNGEVRIGLREREDAVDAAAAVGCHDEGPRGRYELAVIELSTGDSTAPFRVTSVVAVAGSDSDSDTVGETISMGKRVRATADAGVARIGNGAGALNAADAENDADVFTLLKDWAVEHGTLWVEYGGDIPAFETWAEMDGIVSAKLMIKRKRADGPFVISLAFPENGTLVDMYSFKGFDTWPYMEHHAILVAGTSSPLFGAVARILADETDSNFQWLHARHDAPVIHRVRSPLVKPVRTGTSLVPRVLRRVVRRKAAKFMDWKTIYLGSGVDSSVEVRVKEESATFHPWAGTGYHKKYAFTYDGTKLDRNAVPGVVRDAQGVRLCMEAGKSYLFETPAVPKKHPFYFTRSNIGGLGAGGDTERESPSAHSGAVLQYTPMQSGPDKLFYQCESHKSMGGPVCVIGAGTVPLLMHNASTGHAILRGRDDGKFYVERDGAGGAEAVDTLEDAIAASGLALFTTQNIGASIAPDHVGLTVAHVGEDEDACDDDSPAVIVRGDGSLFCTQHVHTLGALQEWLERGMPRGSGQLCPGC